MSRLLGRDLAVDVALLFLAKAALGAYVLSQGFTHVSDDDYARVVIAEQFAHHAALDPSGTSWLPFPFWLNGAAMIAFGRSLAVAREGAVVAGVVSVALPYVAMRAIGCGRATAIAAVGVAMSVPWSAWLGVATVPEAMTACMIAAATIAVCAPRTRVVGGALLLAASLSRYEAWPACAVFAAACGWSARRSERPWRDVAAASLACAGPVAWMAWNAHAHGSPLHFLSRVASYRRAIGAASAPLAERLSDFPRALFETSPVVVALAAVGSIALVVDRPTRVRWGWPLGGAVAILAFLIYGDLRDGAPTHHPERAVVPVVWILAAFAADAIRTLGGRLAWARPAREMWAVGLGVAGALAWGASLPARWRDFPGGSADERREAQIARGRELAASGAGRTAADARIAVTPCAYEHFALIAAVAQPERVDIAPATHEPVTAACPAVVLR